jgi:hypothetical protein
MFALMNLPMSLSSNGTSSLCSKVEVEVVGSSSTGCVTYQSIFFFDFHESCNISATNVNK